MKCLAKEPNDRYPSALDVEDEVEAVLEAIDSGDFEPYLKAGSIGSLLE